MPHMKYFQAVADIRTSHENIVESFEDDAPWSLFLLKREGLTLEDKHMIEEELEVLQYLIGCQHGLSYVGKNLYKPTPKVVNRCFNRHLVHLEEVHGVTYENVNKFSNPMIKKQYKACRHYIFKFSLNGWVKGMPDEIISYENKYPKG